MTVERTPAVAPRYAPAAIAGRLTTWRLVPMIVWNEVYKGLLIQWSYKFNMLMEALMLAFLFLGITFFVGNGQLDPTRLAPSLLGYAVWFYATVAIGTMAYALREEAQQGTLEQWYMSPVPPSVVQVGRVLSTFVVTTFLLLLIVVPLAWGFDLTLPWRWSALPIFVLILVGVYGFGFIVGGATLIFKQVGPLANIVQNMMLFLNGAFLPVERFPRWLEGVAHTLPTTDGILVLQRLFFADASLWTLWQDGSLWRLSLNSAIYLVLGLAVFVFTERLAKRRGLLGQY